MQPRHLIRVALIAAVLVLAACQQMDPYTRTDEWQPNGANAGNISAMVADPYDLIRGRGTDVSDSKASNHSDRARLERSAQAAARCGGLRRSVRRRRLWRWLWWRHRRRLQWRWSRRRRDVRGKLECRTTELTSLPAASGDPIADQSSARHDRPALVAFITDARSEEALRDGLADFVLGRYRCSARRRARRHRGDAEAVHAAGADRRCQRRGTTADGTGRSVECGRTRCLRAGGRRNRSTSISIARSPAAWAPPITCRSR